MDLERYYELRTLLYAWKSRLAEALRRKAEASPQALQRLRTLFDQEGSSDTFSDWLSLWCRQAAIQWILRVLFLRVLEDRGLLGVIRIRTSDGQRMWGQIIRNLGAASYLLWCCRDAAHLLPDLFGSTEFDFLLPNDELVQRFFDDVWRRPDSNREGWLRFDFRPDPAKADEGFQTRFIGDLYQELDSEIRERHALLQTPDFISQFILKYTLLKRFEEKDFRTVTMIDLTCGSGHFIVDGFWAYVNRYEKALNRSREQLSVQERVRIARRVIEEHIFGCDINPYATALARFRLILAACDYARPALLQELRDLRINIVTIDSLIPYEKIVKQGTWGGSQTYKILGHPDDIRRALPILQRRYDVVVGNPPYIFAKDPIKRDLYREHHISAYWKFALSAPFIERFIQLTSENGSVGLIVSNSFATRQFGKVLIENVLPKIDVNAVLDLSGAYIPGHGTPTVIIFMRNQAPATPNVTVVSSLRGEQGIPTDPSDGKVWNSIKKAYQEGPGYKDDFVAVDSRPRTQLSVHPWQLGGSESQLTSKLMQKKSLKVGNIADVIGFGVVTGADEIYLISPDFARRYKFPQKLTRKITTGEEIRDWGSTNSNICIFPYDSDFKVIELDDYLSVLSYFLPWKEKLSRRRGKGFKTPEELGRKWYEFGMYYPDRYRADNIIAFAEISSHNHFIPTEGGQIFHHSAPIIKLLDDQQHAKITLSALLNSSLGCFWLKQAAYNKGSGDDPVRDRFDFTSTIVGSIPLPSQYSTSASLETTSLSLANQLHDCVFQIERLSAKALFVLKDEAYYNWNNALDGYIMSYPALPAPFTSAIDLQTARQQLVALRQDIRTRMIFLQEEMDWLVCQMYGLIAKAPLAEDYLSEADYQAARLELGQRPFELSGKGYQGDWPSGYQPASLPDFLRPLIEARIALIQSNPDITLLEDPLYKRRWIPPDYEQEFREAAAWWLAEKLEFALEQHGKPISLREWVRLLSTDERVNAVLEVLTGSPAFDLEGELLKVIEANAVPNRPEHVFRLSGLRKYLNRPRDGEGLPPEFESKDFANATTWRPRGKLNIPRERFIAYREFDHTWRGETIPDSGGPWYGWAGWNPLQRADALARLLERANRAGWEVSFRQCGLRAALRELLPELKDLRPAERSEFEAIASACGIGLEMRCYCQAFQEAYKQGGPCSPGLSPEVLGLKPIEVESEQPRRGRRKGLEKPTQMEFDL